MIPISPFIVIILGIMDAISTYYALKYQEMILPEVPQHKGEKGLSSKFFIKKYGLKKGLILNFVLYILLAVGVYIVVSFNFLVVDVFLIGLFIGIIIVVLPYNNIPAITSNKKFLKALQNKDKKEDVEKLLHLVQEKKELEEKIFTKNKS